MIHDVKLIPLTRLPDDRGYLTEILRRDDPHFEGFGQIYVSKLRSGVIKAWHKHAHQIDHFFVVSGTSKIGLYDDREDSPTNGEAMQVVLGDDGHNALLQIPKHVWHGQMSLSDFTMLLNLPTEPYNRENPDEIRAAVEAFPDVWSIVNR